MKYPVRDSQNSIMLLLIRMQRCRDQEGGYSLVVTLAMVLILTTLLVTAAIISKIDTASTRASNQSNTGFYSAEAGLNQRAQAVKARFEGFNRPNGNTPQDIDGDGEIWDTCDDPTATAAEQGTGDFGCESETFQNQQTLTFVQENPANPFNRTVPAGEPFAGLSAQEFQYDVISTAQDSQNLPAAILGMTFRSRLVPLFQFAIFYENDGDFSIPPDMTINGRVHSNNDLYLNSASNAFTLQINGQVTTAGRLFRGNKGAAGTQTCAGNVVVQDLGGTPVPLLCGASNTAVNEYVEAAADPFNVTPWGGQITFLSEPLDVPDPSQLDPQPGRLYWDSADLRVVMVLDAAENPDRIEIRDASNNRIDNLSNRLQNSCPVASTTLNTQGSDDDDADPDTYETDDTQLRVASNAGFSAGEAITVGTDIDSNIIRTVNNGNGPRLQIRRQLGHAYQPNAVAATNDIVRKAVVSTSDTFYNYREKHALDQFLGINNFFGFDGEYIRMLDVDVRALLDCVHDQDLMGAKELDDTTEGGLVWFFTVEGDDSNIDRSMGTPANQANTVGSKYGIRLYNGRYLRSTIAGAPEIQGLTIVSDQAVYMQGDYNLKDLPATGVNEGDDPGTAGITERWRPASVLTDSLNVLSNRWNLDDSNSITYDDTTNLQRNRTFIDLERNLTDPVSGVVETYLQRPIPLETTINSAYLSGTEISGGANGAAFQNGVGSGGINNYPRFHERWTGIPFNYRGSFVSLNQPRRVNSDFCGSNNPLSCNIYTPPIRNWDYDTDFNQAQNLPPLSPRAVSLRQELFRRTFNRQAVLPQFNPVAARPNILATSTLASLQPNFIF